MVKNSGKSVIDQVCELGTTCYCNPSFGERLSRFFAITSVSLLIIVVVIYLIYLNRNRLAITLAPKLYYDQHGYHPTNDTKNISNTSHYGSA